MNDKFLLGKWGERHAAHMASQALCGEAKPATLSEEYSHYDLHISFNLSHPPKAHKSIYVQVKTGKFISERNKGTSLSTKNIKKEHERSWRDSGLVLLLMVPDDKPMDVIWKIFTKRTPENVFIKDHSKVTPAFRYELERQIIQNEKGDDSRLALTLAEKKAHRDNRKAARTFWKANREISSTNLGTVLLSRHGWRHMTRKSKHRSRIHDSMRIIPYLRQILKTKASKMSSVSLSLTEGSHSTVERRTILLSYNNICFSNEGPYKVFVRVKSEVSFKNNWLMNVPEKWQLDQKITLESVYRKPPSKNKRKKIKKAVGLS